MASFQSILDQFIKAMDDPDKARDAFNPVRLLLGKASDYAISLGTEHNLAEAQLWAMAAYVGLHHDFDITWDMLTTMFKAPADVKDLNLEICSPYSRLEAIQHILRIHHTSSWPSNFYRIMRQAGMVLPKNPDCDFAERLGEIALCKPSLQDFILEFAPFTDGRYAISPAELGAYLADFGVRSRLQEQSSSSATLPYHGKPHTIDVTPSPVGIPLEPAVYGNALSMSAPGAGNATNSDRSKMAQTQLESALVVARRKNLEVQAKAAKRKEAQQKLAEHSLEME